MRNTWLVIIALSFNLPQFYELNVILILSVLLEEMGKSAGITVLIERKMLRSTGQVILLSAITATGFLIGEKLILLLSMSVISNVLFADVISNASLLAIPLLAHFTFTLATCLIVRYLGARAYPVALLAGASMHYVYNLYVMGLIH